MRLLAGSFGGRAEEKSAISSAVAITRVKALPPPPARHCPQHLPPTTTPTPTCRYDRVAALRLPAPHVGLEEPWERLPQALEALQGGGTVGKVVVVLPACGDEQQEEVEGAAAARAAGGPPGQ